MKCLRALRPKPGHTQQFKQAARNLPAQLFKGLASASTGNLDDLGGQVLADAGQGIELRGRVIAVPYPVAQPPLLTADGLRRALVSANPKRVFIPQRQEIRYLIENLRNLFVLHRHDIASYAYPASRSASAPSVA